MTNWGVGMQIFVWQFFLQNNKTLSLLYRYTLIRTLKQTQLTHDMLAEMGIEIVWHGRSTSEVAHYCVNCEVCKQILNLFMELRISQLNVDIPLSRLWISGISRVMTYSLQNIMWYDWMPETLKIIAKNLFFWERNVHSQRVKLF